MPFLRGEDIISGAEGVARATIDGRVVDLFMVRTFEATMTKNKTGVKVLGTRSEQQKASGWSGEGTMNMFYITTEFRKLAAKYAKLGIDTYFNVTITNEDSSSSVGKQTMVLYDCNLNSTVIAKLDVEADFLDEDQEFTFQDFDILDAFGQPVLAG